MAVAILGIQPLQGNRPSPAPALGGLGTIPFIPEKTHTDVHDGFAVLVGITECSRPPEVHSTSGIDVVAASCPTQLSGMVFRDRTDIYATE